VNCWWRLAAGEKSVENDYCNKKYVQGSTTYLSNIQIRAHCSSWGLFLSYLYVVYANVLPPFYSSHDRILCIFGETWNSMWVHKRTKWMETLKLGLFHLFIEIIQIHVEYKKPQTYVDIIFCTKRWMQQTKLGASHVYTQNMKKNKV